MDVTMSENLFLGYVHKKLVQLAVPVDKKYICHICNEIMTDPIQTTRGELACQLCYNGGLEKKPGLCPIDGEPITKSQIFPDKSVSREIGKLQCVCENEKYGCIWRGNLSDINLHEVNCQFTREPCSGCKMTVEKVNLAKHLEEECPYRSLDCTYCGQRFNYEESEIHEESCLKRPIECPFKCGQLTARCNIVNHINACENILNGTVCPFSVFGCTYKPMNVLSQAEHMITNNMYHTAIVVEKLVFLERDITMINKARGQLNHDVSNYQLIHKELEHNITLLQIENNRLEDKMKALERNKVTKEEFDHKVMTLTKKIEQLESENKIHSKQDGNIASLEKMQRELDAYILRKDLSPVLKQTGDMKKIYEGLQNCTNRIEEVETSGAIANSSLSDLELKFQLLENTTYTGRQIWKIDKFKFRMKQAETGKITALHSPPAFTERFGYKFCTRLYLNGDGLGKGSHLSIFFVVMKSQYDELLEWPFVKRVTFRLLNHEDTSQMRKETFLSDKNSTSFQKPAKEMNIAAGCPMFIAKNQLEQGGYITDDCLFLETIVENGVK